MLVALAACGGDHTPAPSPLELSIETTLAKRLGVAVGASCKAGRCGALTDDLMLIPISLTQVGREVEWRVDGFLITAAELEKYVQNEVTELGAPQGVTCPSRIRRVLPGERVACELEHGGVVFVTIRPDGSTILETLLDPVAAKIRNQLVTPELESELVRASRALEVTEDEAGEDSEDTPATGELLAPDAAR
ncbi:MAG: hypothetical protein SFX73_09510 [Kofleriaceae bacterium]|nr:hypothetical protein [Kofleriaceae bacterium]